MTQPDLFTHAPRFDGSDFDPALDQARLTKQIGRVYAALESGRWLTLRELAGITGDGEASISAQTRHLKRQRFGAHDIQKRRRGDPARGCWEYHLEIGG